MKTPTFKDLKLANPLLMSPLCGVTDLPFRALVREAGAALTHTQMVSCAALVRSASTKTFKIMELAKNETPVGIQLFGCDPAEMAESARMVDQHGADLISINFGCPVPKVVKHNGGSAMLKEPEALQKICEAVVKSTDKPVVPKIRVGWDFDSINALDIGRRVEDAGAAGLVIHGRTRSQGYSGKANWDVIAQVKSRLKIPVIGNGDLFTPEDIVNAMEQSGVDGVMLGRGAMGSPWLFSRALSLLQTGKAAPEPSAVEKIEALLKHLRMNFAFKGAWGLAEMRKQSMGYLKGLPWAAETRNKLNLTLDMDEIEGLLADYKAKLKDWTAPTELHPALAGAAA
ncbi:MAG: tRNA dihydrouridine synthase DusB [candidate division FCPU426 bacterium]